MSGQEFAAIKKKLNDIDVVSRRIRFRVKESQSALNGLNSRVVENQEEITAITEAVVANQEEIAAIKNAIATNQEEITTIKNAIDTNETGIKVIKSAVMKIKAKTDVLQDKPQDDQLATKSDLLELHNKLLKEGQEKSRWYKEYRVAIFAVLAMVFIAGLDIIGRVAKWW